MRVLISPEDFRKDQYILRPLFQRLFASMGKSRIKVIVCEDPLLGGITEALKDARLQEVVDRYRGMIDVFVLCVDRDGETGRRKRLEKIEADFGVQVRFLAENAWEELEVWTLAGLDLLPGWRWSDVRGEVSVKERYFDVLAEDRGIAGGPGGGRKRLGEEAARNIATIRQKCPEDFCGLARRLEEMVKTA